MLSMFPLIFTYDCVYIISHQSLEMFLMMALLHFIPFGIINFIGTYFLYRPIEHIFIHSEDTEMVRKRISHLTWYSTVWIFTVGFLSIIILFVGVFLFQMASEVAAMEEMPPIFFLSVIPSSLFHYAVLPSFIVYFLINDFSLDLKAKTSSLFQILYPIQNQE